MSSTHTHAKRSRKVRSRRKMCALAVVPPRRPRPAATQPASSSSRWQSSSAPAAPPAPCVQDVASALTAVMAKGMDARRRRRHLQEGDGHAVLGERRVPASEATRASS